MTTKEFLTAVENGNINDEVKGFATTLKLKIDERNAKRAAKPSKTAIANEPIKAAIVKALEGSDQSHAKTAPELGALVGITTQKASALAVQLVKADTIKSTTVKVKGKGELKAYYIG